MATATSGGRIRFTYWLCVTAGTDEKTAHVWECLHEGFTSPLSKIVKVQKSTSPKVQKAKIYKGALNATIIRKYKSTKIPKPKSSKFIKGALNATSNPSDAALLSMPTQRAAPVMHAYTLTMEMPDASGFMCACNGSCENPFTS